MTNLQQPSDPRWNSAQWLLAAPLAFGFCAALGLAGMVLWPSWQRLGQHQQQWEQLQEQRQRLPLLREQLRALERNRQQADSRRQRMLGLIAGSGEINTFMAQLSEEAQRSGVQLDGYEPVTTPAVAAGPAKAAGSQRPQQPAAAPDPLLAPGLRKTSLLLTARGRAPQLLDFLRRLERLSLLVAQSDLSLKQDSGATTLRLSLALYSQGAQQGGGSKQSSKVASQRLPPQSVEAP